jgi:hypothetical protein
MPETTSFPIFLRAQCPRFNRRTPARGQAAGGLEYTWRRSAQCSKARLTCRSAARRARTTSMPWCAPARGAGGGRRRGRRGGIRAVHRQQQLWVDAMTPPGASIVNRWSPPRFPQGDFAFLWLHFYQSRVFRPSGPFLDARDPGTSIVGMLLCHSLRAVPRDVGEFMETK